MVRRIVRRSKNQTDKSKVRCNIGFEPEIWVLTLNERVRKRLSAVQWDKPVSLFSTVEVCSKQSRRMENTWCSQCRTRLVWADEHSWSLADLHTISPSASADSSNERRTASLDTESLNRNEPTSRISLREGGQSYSEQYSVRRVHERYPTVERRSRTTVWLVSCNLRRSNAPLWPVWVIRGAIQMHAESDQRRPRRCTLPMLDLCKRTDELGFAERSPMQFPAHNLDSDTCVHGASWFARLLSITDGQFANDCAEPRESTELSRRVTFIDEIVRMKEKTYWCPSWTVTRHTLADWWDPESHRRRFDRSDGSWWNRRFSCAPNR